jgi:nucleotide-binding universal stress UspA family protein
LKQAILYEAIPERLMEGGICRIMPKPRRILFPADFSGCSKRAEIYALDLAQKFNAKIYLLHVFEIPFYSHAGVSAGVQPDLHRYVQTEKETERSPLNHLGKKMEKKGIRVSALFRGGKPPLEIFKTAEEISADFLILGTHGRTGMNHLLLGSVAEKVV